jgi:MFS family permease
MTDGLAQPDPDAIARRNVYVLVAAQAVLGAQLPMVFTVAGQAGKMLSPNPCWATLPVTMMVIGSMLTANPLSALMQRFGRRAGFVAGAAGGFAGAAIGAYGLSTGSFALFLLGALITGIYMSANGFYRFAATDTASEQFRPRAISWVMAGGLLSAFVGPNLVKVTAESMVVPFLGTYLAVMALNAAGVFLFGLLQIPKPPQRTADEPKGRSWADLLS